MLDREERRGILTFAHKSVGPLFVGPGARREAVKREVKIGNQELR